MAIVAVNTAKSQLRRSRRDLIGYNRQQNNIYNYVRLKNNSETNNVVQQIIEFLNKRNETDIATEANQRFNRLRKFRKFHRKV